MAACGHSWSKKARSYRACAGGMRQQNWPIRIANDTTRDIWISYFYATYAIDHMKHASLPAPAVATVLAGLLPLPSAVVATSVAGSGPTEFAKQ